MRTADFFVEMKMIETFPALSGIEGLIHGFVKRIPAVDVGVERDEAMERLCSYHDELLVEMGTSRSRFWSAEQVHGSEIAICEGEISGVCESEADGLVTAERGAVLGIYVADCCAVYLVDTENKACGLVHSGKCGTEQGIVTKAVELMQSQYGTKPELLIAQLSPCIRPPWYEIDFAQTIRGQCRSAGLLAENIHDTGTCTAENVDRYYSYRREKGRTGRMLAVLGWAA